MQLRQFRRHAPLVKSDRDIGSSGPGSSGEKAASLAAFDAYNSPSGLLRRYAIGRLRALNKRVGVALIGVVLLAVLVSPAIALAALFITIPLEMAEAHVLRRQVRRDDFASDVTDRVVTAASFVQILGLAGPIFLAGIQSDGLRLLAWAYLLGASLNSMLSARYHLASHHMRMGVLIATALAICGYSHSIGQIDMWRLLFILAGARYRYRFGGFCGLLRRGWKCFFIGLLVG